MPHGAGSEGERIKDSDGEARRERIKDSNGEAGRESRG